VPRQVRESGQAGGRAGSQAAARTSTTADSTAVGQLPPPPRLTAPLRAPSLCVCASTPLLPLLPPRVGRGQPGTRSQGQRQPGQVRHTRTGGGWWARSVEWRGVSEALSASAQRGPEPAASHLERHVERRAAPAVPWHDVTPVRQQHTHLCVWGGGADHRVARVSAGSVRRWTLRGQVDQRRASPSRV
jgi:hypothetical protein